MFAFVLVSGNLSTYLLTLIIALLHESGHVIAAKICGYNVCGIKFQPFGVGLELHDTFVDKRHEIVISATGPFVNILLIAIGIVFTMCNFKISSTYYIANIYMLCINLVPVMPLDGGRILYAVLRLELGKICSDKIYKIVSVICIAIIMILGVIFFIKSRSNISLFIVALFLLDNIQGQSDKIHSITSLYFSNEAFGYPKILYVNGDTLIKDVLKLISFENISLIFLLDTNGNIVGTTTNKYILTLMSDGYSNCKLSETCNRKITSDAEEK